MERYDRFKRVTVGERSTRSNAGVKLPLIDEHRRPSKPAYMENMPPTNSQLNVLYKRGKQRQENAKNICRPPRDPTSSYQVAGKRCPHTGCPPRLCDTCQADKWERSNMYKTTHDGAYRNPNKSRDEQLVERLYMSSEVARGIGSKDSGFTRGRLDTSPWENKQEFYKRRGFTDLTDNHYKTMYKREYKSYVVPKGREPFPSSDVHRHVTSGGYHVPTTAHLFRDDHA